MKLYRFKKNIRFIYLLIFSIQLIRCSSSQIDQDVLYRELQVTKIDTAKINRGSLYYEKKKLVLNEIKKIKILIKGNKHQIMRYGHSQYFNHKIYILDRFSPEIFVFGEDGNYIKTIPISLKQIQRGAVYSEILLLENGEIIVKDARHSEIYLLDSLGHVNKKYQITDKINFLMPRNMDYFQTLKGIQIYSIIWSGFKQQNLNKVFKEALRVGRFDENGKLVGRYIGYDIIYDKYNLNSFKPTALRIWNKKIYHIQQALPYVRSYSLEGKFLDIFGEPGYHMRPIEKEPNNLSIDAERNFIKNHSIYLNIFILENCNGYNSPIITTCYQNTNNNGEKFNYLTLYSENGKVLYNDLEIPGVPTQVIDGSKLLLLYKVDSPYITYGIYDLKINS